MSESILSLQEKKDLVSSVQDIHCCCSIDTEVSGLVHDGIWTDVQGLITHYPAKGANVIPRV